VRLLTLLLLAISVIVLAFDSVVQVYTKLYVDIQSILEKKTEVYENGELVKSETKKVYTTQASYEIWVLGSGFIIFSGTHKNEEKTLIMTNYHVIEFLTNDITELKKTYTTLGFFKRENGKLEPFDLNESGYRLVVKRVDGPYLIFYWSYKRNNKLTYEVKAELLKYDKLLDVAVLCVEDVSGLEAVRLAKSVDDYNIGEPITIFGAPLGIPFQLTKGTLGQKHLDIDSDWLDMLRYDCPQSPGSSGSAIFASDGKVIGIVRGSFVNMFGATYPGQHLGISIDNVRDWLFLNGYGFVLKANE